jgi:hypothetical protein
MVNNKLNQAAFNEKRYSEKLSELPKYIPQCHFCGGSVGEISERTEELVNAIFDCRKCKVNYCDQCSYEDQKKGHVVQKCLRCNSELDKVTD